MKFKNNFH